MLQNALKEDTDMMRDSHASAKKVTSLTQPRSEHKSQSFSVEQSMRSIWFSLHDEFLESRLSLRSRRATRSCCRRRWSSLRSTTRWRYSSSRCRSARIRKPPRRQRHLRPPSSPTRKRCSRVRRTSPPRAMSSFRRCVRISRSQVPPLLLLEVTASDCMDSLVNHF